MSALSGHSGDPTTAAIIPAAGESRRMGRPKQLLYLDGEPALARVIRAHQGAGVERVIVVTGHLQGPIKDLALGLGANPVHNPRYQQGMFSSLKAGIKALPPEAEAFFVHPVDCPLVRSWTLRILRREFARTRPAALHPLWQGRRGHPPLLSTKLVPFLASWQGQGGLKGALAQAGGRVEEMEAPDESILWDMDAPQDHDRLQGLALRRAIPSRAECLVMLQRTFAHPDSLVDHSRAVARIAELMARALNEAGCGLDLELIRAGGLLHDIGKGRQDHAQTGADILRQAGFAALAGIALEHVDLKPRGQDPLDESELVFLADKMVEGSVFVGIGERFAGKKQRHGNQPGAVVKIASRLTRARKSQARVEALIGRSLSSLIKEWQ